MNLWPLHIYMNVGYYVCFLFCIDWSFSWIYLYIITLDGNEIFVHFIFLSVRSSSKIHAVVIIFILLLLQQQNWSLRRNYVWQVLKVMSWVFTVMNHLFMLQCLFMIFFLIAREIYVTIKKNEWIDPMKFIYLINCNQTLFFEIKNWLNYIKFYYSTMCLEQWRKCSYCIFLCLHSAFNKEVKTS